MSPEPEYSKLREKPKNLQEKVFHTREVKQKTNRFLNVISDIHKVSPDEAISAKERVVKALDEHMLDHEQLSKKLDQVFEDLSNSENFNLTKLEQTINSSDSLRSKRPKFDNETGEFSDESTEE